TGLIHTLPNEEKGPLFKLADPAAQLEKLKSLQLTDEALRASAFRFETVGLTPETATVKKVLDLVQARLNTQSRIVDLTVLARVISDMSIEDLKQVLANERPSEILAARLRDSDFDFVTDKNSSFLKNLQMHLSVETSVASEQFKKPIEMMTSSFPKTWFYSEQRQMTQTVPYLKVIEVHPYLAVHRGCIGGDCSTWASPMFSYSPWEHVFFIQSPDGSFVGYVSATRLTVDGKAVLYLKDLSGAQLSAEIAEQVLTAFRSTLSHFKVEKLYIASPEFTDSQNHYENLIGMFRKYNRKKAQTLHFLDLPVRKYIQKTDIFRSSSSYDSAASHRTGVEFFADPQITKGLNISYQSGTLKPFQPQTPKASLLFALAMLANDPEANLRQIPDLDVAEVRALAALLKNPEKMALAKYYESIKNQFQKYGIELSRSFRLANDTLFYAGHIRASDAFSTENETLRNDSEKFLSQFSRLHKDLFVTLEVVKKWTAYLNGSERFNELVALYRERATLRDVLSLY
ncbi:MAG: hypothetical protein ACXWC9_11680, partial [Pseudobdellovibrionaceae bacterium]